MVINNNREKIRKVLTYMHKSVNIQWEYTNMRRMYTKINVEWNVYKYRIERIRYRFCILNEYRC